MIVTKGKVTKAKMDAKEINYFNLELFLQHLRDAELEFLPFHPELSELIGNLSMEAQEVFDTMESPFQ